MNERCILNVPVRTREWCSDRKLFTPSLTHSIAHSQCVYSLFCLSAQQQAATTRSSSLSQTAAQERLTPVVQWKQVSAQGATAAQTPAAPARHLASWNLESGPLFHISQVPNKSHPTAACNGRVMQISLSYVSLGHPVNLPKNNICDVFGHFLLFMCRYKSRQLLQNQPFPR